MAGNAPSFAGFTPASAVSSKVKKKNTRTDTKHEVILRSRLFRLGLRFRKNVKTLPGKPDIVFPAARTVVFCDGDFWHGRNWRSLKRKLDRGHNAGYWPAKIAANVARDRRNTAALRKDGWRVIRLWETDIRRDPDAAARLVEAAVRQATERRGAR